MIYAMLSSTIARNVRENIARAILAHQDVLPFVQQGFIVHIMDAQADQPYYCVYCQSEVRRSKCSPPEGPEGRHAANHWHFRHKPRHKTEDRCLRTDFGLGSGLINPKGQGCYIQLGHENNADNQPTDRHRTRCQTIEQGRSYCHLARTEQCVDTRQVL